MFKVFRQQSHTGEVDGYSGDCSLGTNFAVYRDIHLKKSPTYSFIISPSVLHLDSLKSVKMSYNNYHRSHSASSQSSISSSSSAASSYSWRSQTSQTPTSSALSSSSWRSNTSTSSAFTSSSWRSPPSVTSASSSTAPSLSAPGQRKSGSAGAQNIHIGTIAYFKPKSSIPTNADIHKQLTESQGAYDHPCVVAAQDGIISTIYLVTSRDSRPMTEIPYSYRSRYRLIEHPGTSTHDGHPTLRLKQGKMKKLCYVNISNRFTIETQHLDSYTIGKSNMLELDAASITILEREARSYEARTTAGKSIECSWHPLSSGSGNIMAAGSVGHRPNRSHPTSSVSPSPFGDPLREQENIGTDHQQRPGRRPFKQSRQSIATPPVSALGRSHNTFSVLGSLDDDE